MFQFLLIILNISGYSAYIHTIIISHHLLRQHIMTLEFQNLYAEFLLYPRQCHRIIQHILPFNLRSC